MKKLVWTALFAACVSLAPAGAAKAEMSDIEILFIKADESGDLLLDLGEVLQITIIQFKESDADGDGLLEAEELGELAKDAEFSDNDSDQSGSLSLEEAIIEKIADFKSADGDGDGVLTLDEVIKFNEGKQ